MRNLQFYVSGKRPIGEQTRYIYIVFARWLRLCWVVTSFVYCRKFPKCRMRHPLTHASSRRNLLSSANVTIFSEHWRGLHLSHAAVIRTGLKGRSLFLLWPQVSWIVLLRLIGMGFRFLFLLRRTRFLAFRFLSICILPPTTCTMVSF